MFNLKISKIVASMILFACSGSVKIEAQVRRDTFLLKPDRPAVYLHIERVGLGNPEEDGKRHRRVWLELHNNCALPVWVATYGAPTGDAADAVGVMDILVKEQQFRITSQPGEEGPDIEPMPLGNFYDSAAAIQSLPAISSDSACLPVTLASTGKYIFHTISICRKGAVRVMTKSGVEEQSCFCPIRFMTSLTVCRRTGTRDAKTDVPIVRVLFEC